MRKIVCLLAMFGTVLSACQKQLPARQPANIYGERFPATPEEKQLVALYQEIAAVLEQVYQDPEALEEVNAAIFTGFYEDERVLLRDLLWPEESELYRSESFLQSASSSGLFKRLFFETLEQGDYPLLRSQLQAGTEQPGIEPAATTVHAPVSPLPVRRLTQPLSIASISIYFPYSATFKSALANGLLHQGVTIVASDREADAGPGKQPDRCGTKYCYHTILVDDDYVSRQPTHILTPGAIVAVTRPVAANPAPAASPVNLIFLGHVLCSKQYDKLISFSGNGGGSELKFIRGDGFLKQNADGQITSPENTISVYLSREEIRKKKWKAVNAIWDANWETGNEEQVFGIYEEDNEGSRTFSGSLVTKVKSLTIEPISYEFTVQTKDEIIRQLKWNRQSFFAYNRGQLNNGCGVYDGSWTIYDCLTPVRYTLPQQ